MSTVITGLLLSSIYSIGFRKDGKVLLDLFISSFFSVALMCIVFTNVGHFSLMCGHTKVLTFGSLLPVLPLSEMIL